MSGDRLHFSLSGKPLSHPAAAVLHRYDSVVIDYGPDNSFPHNPSTLLIKEVEKVKAASAVGAPTTAGNLVAASLACSRKASDEHELTASSVKDPGASQLSPDCVRAIGR